MLGKEMPRQSAAASLRSSAVFAPDDALASRESPGSSQSILIVEDDFLVAADMEAALVDAGFEVASIAATAEDAIASAASQQPILIVMDVRLASKRDGIDAALEIFRAHGIRCIFATAHCDEQGRTRAEPANPIAWLRKPYTMTSLVDTVQRALRDLSAS
jgi:two-component system, response regulator PdtaR